MAQSNFCNQCNVKILKTTYEKTGGFCIPCFQYKEYERKIYEKTNSLDHYESAALKTKFRSLKSDKCPNCHIHQKIELGTIHLCTNCGCRFEVNGDGQFRFLEKKSKLLLFTVTTIYFAAVIYYYLLRPYMRLSEKINSAILPIGLGLVTLLLVPYSYITKKAFGKSGLSFYRRRYPKIYIIALLVYFFAGLSWLIIGVQELLK